MLIAFNDMQLQAYIYIYIYIYMLIALKGLVTPKMESAGDQTYMSAMDFSSQLDPNSR